MMDKTTKAIVFFDGGCPLCKREIAHYRRLRDADNLHWLDISQQADELKHYGINYEQAMALFHVLDRQGNMQTGAYAFITLWSNLNGYRHLARLVTLLGMERLMDNIYRRFARRRLKQRCKTNSCNLP